MKGKKYYGIGAAILLILVAITPAINGAFLEKEEDVINKYGVATSGYDLEVEIIGDPYALDELPVVIENEEYALFGINYKIHNKDNTKFSGKPLTAVIPEEDDTILIDWWYEVEQDGDKEKPIEIPANGYITRYHKIKVKCSKNYEIYFTDKNIFLECGLAGGQDRNPIDNIDIKRAWKFWSDSDKWMPTFGQLKGFGLHSDKKEITTSFNGNQFSLKIPSFMENDKYFPGGFNGLKNNVFGKLKDFQNKPHFNKSQLGLGGDTIHIFDVLEENDYKLEGGGAGADFIEHIWELLETCVEYVFDTLPEAWYNHRFGWVNEMSLYRSRVIVDVVAFALFCLKFYEEGSTQINGVVSWLADLIAIIAVTLTTGYFPWEAFTALIAKIPQLLTDIVILLEIFFLNGYSLIFYAILEKLFLDLKKLKLLRGEEPWNDNIRIYGNVGQLSEDETVTITCRDGSDEVEVNNGEYDFTVSSEYRSGDIGAGYRALHLCQVTCDGNADEHEAIKTRIFASYCYSGGEIHRIFNLNDENPGGGGGGGVSKELIPEPSPQIKTRFNLKEKIMQCLPLFQNILKLPWIIKSRQPISNIS